MLHTSDQWNELNKAGIEAARTLSLLALDCSQRMLTLGIQSTRDGIQASSEFWGRALTSKGWDGNLLAPASLQTGLEQFADLNRAFWQIASETQAGIAEALQEQVASLQKLTDSQLTTMEHSMPNQSAPTIAAVRQAVAAGSAVVESITRAARGAAGMAGAHAKANKTSAKSAGA